MRETANNERRNQVGVVESILVNFKKRIVEADRETK